MGNENSRSSRYVQNRSVSLQVLEISPEEIAKAQRTVLNVLTHTDLVCISLVEENIIREPQDVLKNCELRIYLNEITLVFRAGKCGNKIECFICGTIFNMVFIKKTWSRIWYEVKKRIEAAFFAGGTNVFLSIEDQLQD